MGSHEFQLGHHLLTHDKLLHLAGDGHGHVLHQADVARHFVVGNLVAAEIGGSDTLKELRMLFAAHGIGFIKLDVDNPADSQVLIPARERDEIDWDMANRLATENRDFLEYVKLVKQFYQTGEARPADWDVPELDD